MRIVVGAILMMLGGVIGAYGLIGSFFVAGAMGKPAQNVNQGSLSAIIVIGAFGLAVFVVGVVLVLRKPPTETPQGSSWRLILLAVVFLALASLLGGWVHLR